MRFSTTLSFAVIAAALGLSACGGEKQTVESNTTPAADVASASAPADASGPVLVEPASEASAAH